MTEKFVLHWMEQVCLYEDLVNLAAALVDAVELTLITNAVRGHPKLSGVYNVAVQLASHSGQHVDYDQYSNLLLSAQFAQFPVKLVNVPSTCPILLSMMRRMMPSNFQVLMRLTISLTVTP